MGWKRKNKIRMGRSPEEQEGCFQQGTSVQDGCVCVSLSLLFLLSEPSVCHSWAESPQSLGSMSYDHLTLIPSFPSSGQGDFILFIYLFFISWRLITLQYCSGSCHTLTRISHGFTCIPHPDPPSHLPLHSIPLGLPSAPGPSTCLMHPTWAGDLFHPR